MTHDEKHRYINRELSWLGFNGRVLQEARDPSVPLFDRLGFLAIYSSNLDEFFRVRVASLRSLLRLKKKSIEELGFNPSRLLKKIHRLVTEQQEVFGQVYRGQILKELERVGISVIDEATATEAQGAYVSWYFDEQVRPHLRPRLLDCDEEVPFLKDKGLYLVVTLHPATPPDVDSPAASPGDPVPENALTTPDASYGLVEIPSGALPRFLWVPGEDRQKVVMYLDDVVRYNLPALFPGYRCGGAYAVKLTRDAELYLDDEFSGNLVEKIRKSLGKRETGLPSRFLYDGAMPAAMLDRLTRCFHLEPDDLVEGGRYHNLSDLHGFPRFGLNVLSYEPLPPLPHPDLQHVPSVLDAVADADYLLHYPYHSFEPAARFLQEAAADPDVEEIWISLYRVAAGSAVVSALIDAARRGKQVTAFVEVKARFDEEPNLLWAERMKEAGIQVLYSMPGLKVHAKLALVARREQGARRLYAYLSTGNFNEKTARIYADDALLTADPRLTDEVLRVFQYLAGQLHEPSFQHLLVAPFSLREGFYDLIDREIEHARAGRPAHMILKFNSLEDEKIINRLYRASNAGVRIELLVRGICRLIPGVRGMSENITARSIVDRFLEHARVFWFHNDGEPECYLASADWMRRNLSHRVEVAFPILDPRLRQEMRTLLEIQLADDTKARLLDEDLSNTYYRTENSPSARAQIDTYCLFKLRLLDEPSPTLPDPGDGQRHVAAAELAGPDSLSA